MVIKKIFQNKFHITYAFIFIQNKLMKSRVRIDQTRWRVACVAESFGLDFFVTFFIKEKSKHTVFCCSTFVQVILIVLLKLLVTICFFNPIPKKIKITINHLLRKKTVELQMLPLFSQNPPPSH